MEQSSPDPFFEKLKADIQEGVDEADVWKHVHAVIYQIEQKSRPL